MQEQQVNTEAQVIPETVETKPEVEAESPENVAARMYSTLITQFDAQVGQLSKKGLWRVLQMLIKDPLEDVHFKLQGNLEKNVYILAQRLLDAKFIMISHVMAEAMQQAEEESESDGHSEENAAETAST